MDGIQKTVSQGLRYMANKVEEGAYGEGDDAFEDELAKDAFLEDLEDNVISKTE